MPDIPATIELVFDDKTHTLPYVNDADLLLDAMGRLKTPGTNDLAFCGYASEVDLARIAPFVDKLIEYVAGVNHTEPEEPPTIEELLRRTQDKTTPNISIPKLHDSAYYLSKVHPFAGGFFRLDSFASFAIFPAINPFINTMRELDDPDNLPIDIVVEQGIVSDLSVICRAMRLTGYNPELIDYRDEPDFFAFRRPEIGQFLLNFAGYSH